MGRRARLAVPLFLRPAGRGGHRRPALCFDGLDTFADRLAQRRSRCCASDNMFVPDGWRWRTCCGQARTSCTSCSRSALRQGQAREAERGAAYESGTATRAACTFARRSTTMAGIGGRCLLTPGPWRAVRLEAYQRAHRRAALPCRGRRRSAQRSIAGARHGGNPSPPGRRASRGAAETDAMGLRAVRPGRRGASTRRCVPVERWRRPHTFTVEWPQLWWPHGHGAQPLYAWSPHCIGGRPGHEAAERIKKVSR